MRTNYFLLFFITIIVVSSCTEETKNYLLPDNAVLQVSPQSGSVETQFTFDASKSVGAVEYYFSTGEGEEFFVKADLSSINHIYSNPGTYNVVVKTINKEGYEYFDNRIVEVFEENTAPSPIIEIDTLNKECGYYEIDFSSTFDAQVSNQFLSYKCMIQGGSHSIDTLLYDFKVGEKKIKYLFQEGGEYTISLSVMDPEGLDSTIEKTLNIEEPTKLLDLRDGKIYNLITVGNVKFLAENFAYESYDSQWYNDSIKYKEYGRYYLKNDAIARAPKGWRLPTSEDFSLLIEYTTNSEYTAGNELKKPGVWPSGTGSDPLGFSALPAGNFIFVSSENRFMSGYLSMRTIFWCHKEGSANATYYTLFDGLDRFNMEDTEPAYNSYLKLSVRYVRDPGSSY